MNSLEKKLIDRIAREGPITFESFMAMVLYEPENGYYSGTPRRIGREGDFYTSSHLHPLFGIMLGWQIREMWAFLGKPDKFCVVEMGAGEGFVCRDMLDHFSGSDGNIINEEDEVFYSSLQYMIIEQNHFQQQRQKDLLIDYEDKVLWQKNLHDAGIVTGCILSNELLDAFPVHLVTMEDELREVYVGHDSRGFFEHPGPLSSEAIKEYVMDFAPALERGHITEVNLRIRSWLQEIDAVLGKGFILTIDYGFPAREYYNEDRNRGTLMCYYRHRLSEDFFSNIGDQDITAHVNFSSLKRWGEERELRTIGYCGQGTFLLAAGIDREISRLAGSSKDYLSELGRIKKLFLPQGLGESHKVMVQYKGPGLPKLQGFSIRNQVGLL
jgi:SAM-dependent MidA family methyltransferase